MSFKQIFLRDWGAILMVPISTIAGIFSYFWDFLNLKSIMSDEFALLLYTLLAVGIYILLVYLKENLNNKKLTITPVYYLGDTNKNFVGHSYFCGLEIEIPKNWDVTECYAILDRTSPVYNKDRKYFEKEVREILSYSEKQYKRLSWRSPYAPGCKIDIGGYSNKEVINIAQINLGTYVTKSQNINIENFEFSFCQNQPNKFKYDIFGLHEVSISIHWKLDGIKRTPILFEGYLFSKIEGTDGGGIKPTIILRKGDYREDKEIPTPLFRVK
jgi:hypothetical protein